MAGLNVPSILMQTSMETQNREVSNIETQFNSYLLHHSFSPATVLVTQQLIGACNYNSWSRVMLIALSTKNKVGFVVGMIKMQQ